MTLSKHNYRLSTESTYVKKSVIRDLIKHAVDPDMISFAAGLPAGETLPVEAYQACLSDVIQRDGARAMQYSPQHLPLREQIVSMMQARGVDCTVDNVFITNGNQQGLNILSRLFLDAGSPAVLEEATFTGINLAVYGRGADVRSIPTDLATGADMDALESAFQQAPTPQMAVLITDFHNPLGVSLSPEKRQRAAQLANHYQVPLVEDDPYGLLRFEGDPLPPMKAYDTDGFAFYLGSFSKILAPGLRLGWMLAPAELIPKITVLREAIDLETATLTQRAVAEFLRRDLLTPHLENANAENHIRCQAMLSALDTHMTGIAEWTKPEGGLFIWVKLHDEAINTMEIIHDAIDNNVVYIPGGAFAGGGGQHNAIRLNFSNVTPQKIETGVKRLTNVLKKHLS